MNTQKIVKLMAMKKMTKYQLAKQSNISESQVGRIIRGEQTDPRISTLKAIARALGVDVREII